MDFSQTLAQLKGKLQAYTDKNKLIEQTWNTAKSAFQKAIPLVTTPQAEIAKTVANKIAPTVWSMTGEPVVRTLAEMGLDVAQKKEYTPQSEVVKEVLGKEVVKPFSERLDAVFQKGEKLSKYGVPTGMGAALGVLGLTGSIATEDLIFTPAGKAKGIKPIAAEIAKTGKVSEVLKLLKGTYETDVKTLRPLAKQLSKITDEKAIIKTLESVAKKEIPTIKQLEPLAEEARKYKTAVKKKF